MTRGNHVKEDVGLVDSVIPVNPFPFLVVACPHFLFLNTSSYQVDYPDLVAVKRVPDDVHGHGLVHIVDLWRHQVEVVVKQLLQLIGSAYRGKEHLEHTPGGDGDGHRGQLVQLHLRNKFVFVSQHRSEVSQQ